MKKLTLLLLSSLFMTISFAEEIEDLQRVKYCFALEENNTKQTKELETAKSQLAQKQKSQDLAKQKLDREMRNIKAAEDIDKKRLSRWEADNKKHTQEELNLGDVKQQVSYLSLRLEENSKNKKKFQCNHKYSEEAIEKVCVIDKQNSSGCSRMLNGAMKHLKE